MKNGSSRIKAFTLIELLVVIAIIALLLSITMPALKKAKDKAKEIICRSHAKGIGTAVLLYLSENESRAFNNRQSNGHLWYDNNGKVITPDNAAWWEDAYWGLGYRDYAENEEVFSCPSFVLKNMADLVYSERANYKTTRTDLTHAAGFALNSYFFRDPDAATTDPNRNHRKSTSIRSPSRFIVMHDHMEPKVEGDSSGGDQGDMFYIPAGSTFNLLHYRTGDRKPFYGGIFRHGKINKSWDDPANLAARIPLIEQSPNGRVDVLFLDGSVDKIDETIGKDVPYSMYRGLSR